MKNGQTFIEKNALRILFIVVSVVGTFTFVQLSVQTNAQDISDLKNRVTTVENLIERVIVLEERERSLESDIKEIKLDLKDIKNFLNVR